MTIINCGRDCNFKDDKGICTKEEIILFCEELQEGKFLTCMDEALK